MFSYLGGMRWILILVLLGSPSPKEKKVGSGVQFFVAKDHNLNPVLPLRLLVTQESGGIPEGLITCDVVSRTYQTPIEDTTRPTAIVLNCGGRVLRVTGIQFTESASKGY